MFPDEFKYYLPISSNVYYYDKLMRQLPTLRCTFTALHGLSFPSLAVCYTVFVGRSMLCMTVYCSVYVARLHQLNAWYLWSYPRKITFSNQNGIYIIFCFRSLTREQLCLLIVRSLLWVLSLRWETAYLKYKMTILKCLNAELER